MQCWQRKSLIFPFLAGGVSALIFSRIPSCDNRNSRKSCSSAGGADPGETLAIEHSLLNEESLSLSASLTDDAPSLGRLQIDLEKSATTFEYDLSYEADVPWRIDEMYLPFWQVAACASQEIASICSRYYPASLPDGSPMLGGTGRCCRCSPHRLGNLGIGASMRRVGLHCNLFDQALGDQPDSVVVCPSVSGQWHAVYSFGAFTWDYQINVTLSWGDPEANAAVGGHNESDVATIDDPLLGEDAALEEFRCLERVISSFNFSAFDEPNSQETTAATAVEASNAEATFELERKRVELQLAAAAARRECNRQRTSAAYHNSKTVTLRAGQEAYFDEQTGLTIRILGSQPTTGRLPPPMNENYLILNLKELDTLAESVEVCSIDGALTLQELTALRKTQRNSLEQQTPYHHNELGSRLESTTTEALMGAGKPEERTVGIRFVDEDILNQSHEARTWSSLGRTYNNTADLHRSKLNRRQHCLKSAFLLKSSQIDLTGKNCDRIGTSMMIWSRPNAEEFCALPRGFCLGDQLYTYWERDLMRVAAGKLPQHLISSHSLPGFRASVPFLRFTNKASGGDNRTKPTGSGAFRLGWTYPENHATRISIELPAHSLLWHRVRATAAFADIDSFSADCGGDKGSYCPVKAYVRNESVADISRLLVGIPYCVMATTKVAVGKDTLVLPGQVALVVKPRTIDMATLVLRKFALGPGEFTCKAVLQESSSGRVLDSLLFNVTFAATRREYLGVQAGVWGPHRGTFVKDVEGRSVSLMEFMSSLSLPFKGNGLLDMQTGKCSCSPLNVFCLATHFWSCVSKARQMAFSAASFAALLFSVYMCGSPFTLCLRIGLTGLRSARRKGKSVSKNATRHFCTNSGVAASGSGAGNLITPRSMISCGGDFTPRSFGI